VDDEICFDDKGILTVLTMSVFETREVVKIVAVNNSSPIELVLGTEVSV